jgi:hypothetical protein
MIFELDAGLPLLSAQIHSGRSSAAFSQDGRLEGLLYILMLGFWKGGRRIGAILGWPRGGRNPKKKVDYRKEIRSDQSVSGQPSCGDVKKPDNFRREKQSKRHILAIPSPSSCFREISSLLHGVRVTSRASLPPQNGD